MDKNRSMTKSPEYEYVPGTSGNPDYLVIARSGRCAIAIKPEMEVNAQLSAVFLGIRLRVCADPQQAESLAASPLTATEIAQVLPNLPMPNTDQVRGSAVFGSINKIDGDITLKNAALSIATNKFMVLKIVSVLQNTIKHSLIYNQDEIADFVQSRWEQIALKLGQTSVTTKNLENEAAAIEAALKNIGFNMEQ